MTRCRELVPPPELREHVLCGWTLGPVAGNSPPVLPDGCMDIVWREDVGTIGAGPDTAAVRPSRAPGSTVVGIRFRPGAAPPMLGVPASELRDLRVPLAEVWDNAGRWRRRSGRPGRRPLASE